jgi:hypothetical protein
MATIICWIMLPPLAVCRYGMHHADRKREDAYDKHTEQVQNLVKEGSVTEIDMDSDWSIVFKP